MRFFLRASRLALHPELVEGRTAALQQTWRAGGMATRKKAAAGRNRGERSGPRRTKSPRRLRGTGAAYVYDSLKAQILDLELQPGTLLDETQVSRQFGVSRS